MPSRLEGRKVLPHLVYHHRRYDQGHPCRPTRASNILTHHPSTIGDHTV